MAEETLENINTTDSNINFDETKEAVDLEELQEAASFLKISELKSCPTEAASLKENHKFNNLIIPHKITKNPKINVIGNLIFSADVI